MSPQRSSRAEKAARKRNSTRTPLRRLALSRKDSARTEKKRDPTGPNFTKEALSRYDPVIAEGALPSVRRGLGGSGPPEKNTVITE